ncbi:pyridoxal-phosphate dependent enzyme [Oscillochloris sp. ZM17-4]|uniref:threonine ammonia-lyase n=1 Tax=Oscillochloris sp. ZM17-4 TaxID=2866714 RepID=UPI001C730A15|nr:pyridoxal-phosphate dependent enzyme [Oscillochloris sp. ZM17-4]MBX0327839.1 pyridoxal-phosphate dependent enzyme [Oscillochloris sp. ZM17-4]
MSDLSLSDIRAAAARIAPYIIRTPLLPSRALSDLLGARVSLKYEFLQETSSFKPRGAFHKILGLDDTARARGLLAVSGGNHGKGVAFAARQLGLSARIIMFESTAPSAVAAARAYGAQVDLLPNAAAGFARAGELEAEGYSFIHPFADPEVVAGQGTLGLEILADAPDVTDVIASIGGGGMIGGVAMAIRERRPETRIWGVETVGADAMSQALAAGQIVHLPAITSIAATLGAPSVSELTLSLAQRYLEEVLVRPDADAVADMVWLLDSAKVLVEPSAAVTLSAARQLRGRITPGGHLVLILCGASISLAEMMRYREQFRV